MQKMGLNQNRKYDTQMSNQISNVFQRGKLITNQRIEAKYMMKNRIKNIIENETNDRTEKIII